jgi:hypothetical protein
MLRRLIRMIIFGAFFAFIGACLDLAAFVLGIASTGIKNVPERWTIVGYLADWPNLVLVLLLPQRLANSLFDTHPMLYFVLPIVGWALVGVCLGAWTARRKSSHGHY